METLKKNWPLFACTVAIVVTLVGCTAIQIHQARHMAYAADELNTIRHMIQDVMRGR